MDVLYHLSHCSSTKPDGWSGAPGEATWVRALVAEISVQGRPIGITVHTVDGDLEDHPAFHADYAAFVAPHYEADVHGVDGSFWGRAAASVTAAKDDKLGAQIWWSLRSIGGYKPEEHFGWNNVNVTDYYGFRLTSAKTPGALIEHAVGNRHPQGYDYVRNNIKAIAAMHVIGLAAFGGISVAQQYVTKTEFDTFRQALQKQLDDPQGGYARKTHTHQMSVAVETRTAHNTGLFSGKQMTAFRPRRLTAAMKKRDGHGTAKKQGGVA